MTGDEFSASAHDAVARLIGEADPGAMVTRFVVVAEVVDADGERAVWQTTAEGQRSWDTLGLLAHAKAAELGFYHDEDCDDA